jgi:hypothetical protein
MLTSNPELYAELLVLSWVSGQSLGFFAIMNLCLDRQNILPSVTERLLPFCNRNFYAKTL